MTSISKTGSYRSDISRDWHSPPNRSLRRIVTALCISALVLSLSATRYQPPPLTEAVDDPLELDLAAIQLQVAAMK